VRRDASSPARGVFFDPRTIAQAKPLVDLLTGASMFVPVGNARADTRREAFSCCEHFFGERRGVRAIRGGPNFAATLRSCPGQIKLTPPKWSNCGMTRAPEQGADAAEIEAWNFETIIRHWA
jgi:hypothetical protein